MGQPGERILYTRKRFFHTIALQWVQKVSETIFVSVKYGKETSRMNVSGVAKAVGSAQARPQGAAVQTDSQSKGIQNQIANAREKLQKLSENKDLTSEEKMKRRQEIQQQITELERQLRQHQMEQRKERSKGGSTMEDFLGDRPKAAPARSAKTGRGMSKAGMQALISADVSMKQAQVQGSVSARLQGQAMVLQGEIRRDKDLGIDVRKKEEELADLNRRTQELTASRISALADTVRESQKAAEAEADSKAEPKDSSAVEKKEKEEKEQGSGPEFHGDFGRFYDGMLQDRNSFDDIGFGKEQSSQ